jgi:hypothetical protein
MDIRSSKGCEAIRSPGLIVQRISLSLRMSAAQPVDSQRQIKNINALMNHHHVSLLGDYGVRNQPLPGLCVPFCPGPVPGMWAM